MSNVVKMGNRELAQFNLTKSIGEFGLIKPVNGFTQEELDQVGELLGRVDNSGAWNRGDWYNEQEKAPGTRSDLEPVGKIPTSSAKDRCEQYFQKSQADICKEAAIAARFPDEPTRRKLTFSHFKVLYELEQKHGDKIDVDRFITMAMIGDRYPGEFDETQKYRKQPWTAAQLKRAILIELHELTDTHVKEVDKAEADALSGISSILDSRVGKKLTATDCKSMKAELEREIKAAFSELRNQFKDQVVKASTQERVELEQERRRLAKERGKYENSLRAIPSQMSTADFKLILGCLHPDKCDPDLRERYAKAFDIFNSLKDTNRLG